METNKKQIGDKGEDLAIEMLVNENYEIVERNYRFGHGEIDIIAKKNDILVFIEVKTRKNLEYGMPELAVTKNKQRQIRKIAEAYLYEKKISDIDCRIDVIAILIKKNLPPEINHIENAF
ncbi:MAG: YraN family protein [Ignavibacteriales bacterium]|nr:YraN family protein [Ignavibacteriales bacterium]